MMFKVCLIVLQDDKLTLLYWYTQGLWEHFRTKAKGPDWQGKGRRDLVLYEPCYLQVGNTKPKQCTIVSQRPAHLSKCMPDAPLLSKRMEQFAGNRRKLLLLLLAGTKHLRHQNPNKITKTMSKLTFNEQTHIERNIDTLWCPAAAPPPLGSK